MSRERSRKMDEQTKDIIALVALGCLVLVFMFLRSFEDD